MENKQLDPLKIKEILNKNYTFIDLRLHRDFNLEHIQNFINIPYDTFKDFNLEINKPIILLCYSGSISDSLALQLNKIGYDAYSIQGGFQAIMNPINDKLY